MHNSLKKKKTNQATQTRILLVYTNFSPACFQFIIFSCLISFCGKSIAGVQTGAERFTGPDLDFMKEIEELAKGFIETAEKAMALEKLWLEENSKCSGRLWFF